ncbi:MAG: 4Fe-4S binding protein [Verrucomicrobia bacterium]|nr:4Fe-4S binding protein [Verrucomicrobiota bacterium]
MVQRGRRLCTKPGSACVGCEERAGCGLPPRATVWQLDPEKCIQCGKCATHCVLDHSAVRCFHSHARCGYCKLCFGYFEPGTAMLTEAAENQLCPTGAIHRNFVEAPYYEYVIEEDLCVGCGKCVRGCNMFGNGSLYLQVHQKICLNCNECSIAKACPADAFSRVSPTEPYLRNADGSSKT